jgi:hypothetical protein
MVATSAVISHMLVALTREERTGGVQTRSSFETIAGAAERECSAHAGLAL